MTLTRSLKLAALALSTVLLLIAAWGSRQQWEALRLAQSDVQRAQAAWQAAQSLLPELERREQAAAQVQALTSALAAQGFDRGHWGERRIRRSLGELSRVDASRFLSALVPPGAASILVADQFELSVRSKGAGLFQTPEPGDEGVQLALLATQYVQNKAR